MPDAARAAEWLAENLMGFRKSIIAGVHSGWIDKDGNYLLRDNWQPDLYPEGLMQCFGPGGIVEFTCKMGYEFLGYWRFGAGGPWGVEFRKPLSTKAVMEEGQNLCAATVLAAARTLGWEG